MTSSPTELGNLTVRPCHYGDLEGVESLTEQPQRVFDTESRGYSPPRVAQDLATLRRWYGPLKLLSWFPNPLQNFFSAYVAEQSGGVRGVIQVAPCNYIRSTWRIERIAAGSAYHSNSPVHFANGKGDNNDRNSAIFRSAMLASDVASHLLRHCLETIWEARTWMVEVSVNDKAGMGLYRQHGFQSLAQMTYWEIAPELLTALAKRDAQLPNLRSASNADASLLHQLDTVSMPPLVRQVFDRHVSDFKVGVAQSTVDSIGRLVSHQEVQRAYVFEPQRKAAIGYFRLEISQNGKSPHHAHLTVHPAYTWLYPELLTHMARLLQGYSAHSLKIASSDYQPEREEYLTKIGAERTEHTLMMSRSVWHKVRETKPSSLEGLQLAEVLQGLKPSRKPIPGRFSWISPFSLTSPSHSEISDSVLEQRLRFSQEHRFDETSLNHRMRSPSDALDEPSRDCHDTAEWPTNGIT